MQGQTLRVARGSKPLRLRALKAQILSKRTASTISNSYGISATANGKFVTFSLKITNRTGGPEEFDTIGESETLLYADGGTYSEAFAPENQADQQSFLSLEQTIQSGESETGDVIFDLPPKRAAAVMHGKKSALFVGNFGYSFSSDGAPHHAGLIVIK